MAARPRPPVHVQSAALALTAACLLAGCSDDGPGSRAEPSPTASEPASESPTPAPTPSEVALREDATITLSAGERRGEVSVSVTKVRKGKIKDLSDFVLDRRTRRSTPYYADVRVENISGTNLAGASVPLWGLDSTDTVLPAAQVRGTFGTCADKAMPKKFTEGKEARTCLMFLVPRGAQLQAVQYRSSDEADGPISWPAGG